jgi:Ca2+-binding EF-hand superfamily protein
MAPPPPPPLKRPPPVQAAPASAETLEQTAADLLAKAEELESQKVAPSVRMQLGLLLTSSDDYIKRCLKDWDTKGKGEFLRAEFRLNLRNTGLNTTSAEADALFDSWDEDRGGSLDLKELRTALEALKREAQIFKSTPDPNVERARALRHRAALAQDAARATAAAERMEQESEELTAELDGAADIQLGGLLFKRRIKPGAVVTNWAKSRGAHAGELSKAEFREQVLLLGVNGTSAAEIDDVFDTFDEDGGGWMDADEAASMVKALQSKSEKAEHDKRAKANAARAMRSKATKKAVVAMAPRPEETEAPPSPEPAEQTAQAHSGGSEGPVKKRRGKKKAPPSSGSPSARAPSPSSIALEAVSNAMNAAGTAIVGLMSDRAAQRQKKALENANEATERNFKQFLAMLQRLQSARAFRTWRANKEAIRHALQELEHGARGLKNPFVLKGMNTWVAWYEGRVETIRLLTLSTRHLKHHELLHGWDAFVREREEGGRRRAVAQTLASGRQRVFEKRTFAYFDVWHRIQMQSELERHLEAGVCCFLGYWLKSSIRQCKPRDVHVPVELAQRLRARGNWCV